MRKKVQDAQMLDMLRGQVLQQQNRRLREWPLRRLPRQTVSGVLGVSERDIGVEIKASKGTGTEFKLFLALQVDDQEIIIDGVNLVPLAELGGVKSRQLWGNSERRRACIQSWLRHLPRGNERTFSLKRCEQERYDPGISRCRSF